MQKTLLAGLAVTLVLVGSPSAQDAKAVVAGAARTLGVDTLKTVQYSATGLRFRARPGAEPEFAVAEVHQQELHARDQLRDAGVAGGPRPRAGREPAARRRPAAGRRRAAAEPDDHRQRRHAVGAAARDLDDAARLPARGGGQKRDGRSEDGRRQEVQRGHASSATTRPRSTATSTTRTWSSASRPGSTTRSSATCRSRRSTATTRTSAARSSRCTSCRSRAAIRSST